VLEGQFHMPAKAINRSDGLPWAVEWTGRW
jgi:hypothetical protein